jgi:hypothetical protein
MKYNILQRKKILENKNSSDTWYIKYLLTAS